MQANQLAQLASDPPTRARALHRSINCECSRRDAQSRRLHLRDQQLGVAQLPCWQLRADQLAQLQVTR